jgi:hypothetical protein
MTERAPPRRRLGASLPRIRGSVIAQITDLIGRSPTTIKAYFYDRIGEKAREVKARCAGL